MCSHAALSKNSANHWCLSELRNNKMISICLQKQAYQDWWNNLMAKALAWHEFNSWNSHNVGRREPPPQSCPWATQKHHSIWTPTLLLFSFAPVFFDDLMLSFLTCNRFFLGSPSLWGLQLLAYYVFLLGTRACLQKPCLGWSGLGGCF